MQDTINSISDAIRGNLLHTCIAAVLLIVVTFVVCQLAIKLIRKLLSSDGIPLTSSSIIENILRISIWAIGLSIMLSTCFGIDVNGFVTALGVGGIALSLGLQDTIKNFIGGLQITLMSIVKPGDHIVVGDTDGIVQDVTWRQTIVKDYENSIHLIPNAQINSSRVVKIEPSFLVSTIVVLNNDGRDLDAMLRHMERLAKDAVQKVAPLERDPWILVTQIGEYGIWTKMRFVLKDVERAREARDAAMRAISPFTRNNSSEVLTDGDLA